MKTLAWILGLSVCGAIAGAQTRGTEVDLRSLLGSGREISAPLTPGERVQAESDALSASSEAALSAARSNFNQYQLNGRSENDARARALMARRRFSNLELEKDKALDEMRRGLFCRACHRTRSQVEAAGENWQHHLDVNSQGRAVGATPEELASKAREFDADINNARADEYHALQQAGISAHAKAAAAQDVIDSFARWKMAMLSEDQNRATAWEDAVKGFKERFYSNRDEVQKLDATIARERTHELRSQKIQELESERQSRLEVLGQLSKDAEEEYFARRIQASLFEQRLTNGRKELESLVAEVGGPPLSTISSITSLPTISGKAPDTALKVPFTPFSVAADSRSLTFTASAGLFRMSLRASEDWLRSKLNVDVVLGVDTPYGPLEGGIRQSCGPDGCEKAPIGNAPTPITAPDPLDLLTGKKSTQPK